MRSEDEPFGAWSGACWVAELREGEAGPPTVGRAAGSVRVGEQRSGWDVSSGGHPGGRAPTAPPALVKRPCFAAAPWSFLREILA